MLEYKELQECNNTTTPEQREEFIFKSLQLREQLLAQNEEQIKNLQYGCSLIEKDILDIYLHELNHSGINAFVFCEDHLVYAWHYMNAESEEAKEKFKYSYNYIMKTMNNTLLKESGRFKPDDFKLKKIVNCAYSGYEFWYDYKGIEFYIYIPVFSRATLDNYKYYMIYRAGYQKSTYFTELISGDLDYNKVIEKLHEWLTNKEVELRKASKTSTGTK